MSKASFIFLSNKTLFSFYICAENVQTICNYFKWLPWRLNVYNFSMDFAILQSIVFLQCCLITKLVQTENLFIKNINILNSSWIRRLEFVFCYHSNRIVVNFHYLVHCKHNIVLHKLCKCKEILIFSFNIMAK